MTTSTAHVIPFRKVLSMLVGLLGVGAAMTILFLGMRAVMDVGGYCAEGGPYQIAVHCPKGVAAMVPLSILSGLALLGLYAFGTLPGGPNMLLFAWTALFGSLGWNFLEYGMKSPGGGQAISWLICAVVFFLMAVGPLFLLGWRGLWAAFFGKERTTQHPRVPLWYISLHTIALPGGIFLGMWLYQLVAFSR